MKRYYLAGRLFASAAVCAVIMAGVARAEDTQADAVMIDVIKGRLSEHYKDADNLEDESRLGKILSDGYSLEYAKNESEEPVEFSNFAYSSQEARRQVDAKAMEETFTLEMMTIIAGMSEKQIDAVTRLMDVMRPRDEARSSAENIEGSEIAKTGRVVAVGNGEELAFDNWEVEVDGRGSVWLNNNLLPGARFEIQEGMVVGQFGRVEEISKIPGNVYVAFDNGERIEAVSSVLIASEEVSEDEISVGEIIISEPLPVEEIRQRNKGAVHTASRPIPRPDQIPEVTPDQQGNSLLVSARPLTRPLTRPIETATAISDATPFAPEKSSRPRQNPSRI